MNLAVSTAILAVDIAECHARSHEMIHGCVEDAASCIVVGLFDMILLKDNHVDFAGGIKNAITRCHEYLKEKNLDLKIELEVRNFDELNQALEQGGINRVMLDNFSVEDTAKAVKIVNGKYVVESSGGITFDTIRDYAECGVDFISVGALTHSVKGLDMSFKACD